MLYSYTNLAFAALSILSVQAAPLSQDNTVSISSITHWGTGCPQDTSDFSVRADGNSIIAHFGSFDVSPTPQDQMTEFCGVGVTIASPSGRQFSAASTSYHDDVDVANGVTGSHIMTYTFPGSQSTAETRHDFVGPVKGGFDICDRVPDDQRVWSPCGQSLELMITNRGSVTGKGSGTSYFNAGTASTAIEWRNC